MVLRIIVGVLMLAFLCLSSSGTQTHQKADADTVFAEIKSLQPTIRRVPLQSDDVVLTGRYQDRIEGSPSMSEEDIYLFPDHSYIYTLMTDVAPQFITDQGGWQYVNGVIELKPNTSNDKVGHNLRFIILLFDRSGKTYQMILGLDGDQEQFINEAKRTNPQLILDKSSYKKTEEINEEMSKGKKEYLLECCSKPRSHS